MHKPENQLFYHVQYRDTKIISQVSSKQGNYRLVHQCMRQREPCVGRSGRVGELSREESWDGQLV